ncbi:MucR family transcriptional regulator [Methylobacterium nodulans]|uniref:Transcriptional regulator, MucR family n=1 Tax=Methylobacterium nodulans (strain LMG 21967 / CNCM I-2342 / ORS 2060) TaxID=460265 RepID=B8IDE4_METNO|nr:MucR family transcriptional regulator [Methylobacterium nodulans]ACL61310.1 transcriptional regulator, MucR family [Methylobacterium nodulans ORS 2060]
MNSENQTEAPQTIELVSDIVSAYVSNNSVPVGELAGLIRSVHDAVARLGAPAAPQPEKLVPPVPIKKTITPDYLISLEDGRRYRTLKRHLAGRGLTPEQYRAKWGLPPDYPMVAANYAAQRSELAKSIGLGQKPVARRARSQAA